MDVENTNLEDDVRITHTLLKIIKIIIVIIIHGSVRRVMVTFVINVSGPDIRAHFFGPTVDLTIVLTVYCHTRLVGIPSLWYCKLFSTKIIIYNHI